MDTHSPTYTRLFKEDWELLCSASSMAAVDSPAAYLKALYLFAQALEESGKGQAGKVTLDQRRPELKALPINEHSLTAVIPNCRSLMKPSLIRSTHTLERPPVKTVDARWIRYLVFNAFRSHCRLNEPIGNAGSACPQASRNWVNSAIASV